ncbi:MAG: dsbD 1 [Francisellaceae bacterium]|nr:dsbD 1 [Francisellaceae bacterium]
MSSITGFANLYDPEEKNNNPPFSLSAKMVTSNHLRLNFTIEPGFYLYQRSFIFYEKGNLNNYLKPLTYPQASTRLDSPLPIYKTPFSLEFILNDKTLKNGLIIEYQGCSEKGICLPPEKKQLKFINHLPEIIPYSVSTPPLTQKTLKVFLSYVTFFIMGILLSFTPCVLPLMPIVLNILVGKPQENAYSPVILSILYVISMSFTYTLLGLGVGVLGIHIPTIIQQHPSIIIVFSFILLIMACYQFEIFNFSRDFSLKFPSLIKFKQGTAVNAILVGAASSILLSPCITPALIGALAYVGQTGDAFFGGIALFIFSIGMGIPFILLSMVGGHFLPKAGAWMIPIKQFTGVLLLALCLELLANLLPFSILKILCYLWLIGSSCIILFFKTNHTKTFLIKYLLLFIFWGLSGVWINYIFKTNSPIHNTLPFKTLRTLSDLNLAFEESKNTQKPLLIDVYANWCRTCKIQEQLWFKNITLRELFTHYVLYRVDITGDQSIQDNLIQGLGIVGAPTYFIYSKEGKLIHTLNGEIKENQIIKALREVEQLN